MNRSKKQQLDELERQILADNICPELSAGATQLVFGGGNLDADIVFVGEAPGKKEDIEGQPFIGASGKSLDSMLETINLDRSDIYITNIVKYRPPNNRDPKQGEKAAFLPYLLKQISIIAPKLIVTLGRHSMDVLLPGLKISDVHGQLVVQDGANFMPMYHPAAAMYNGSLRQTLAEDFAKLSTILRKLN